MDGSKLCASAYPTLRPTTVSVTAQAASTEDRPFTDHVVQCESHCKVYSLLGYVAHLKSGEILSSRLYGEPTSTGP